MKDADKTMGPAMVPKNEHTDIPGNPSTAKSSDVQLRKEATADSLRVLSMEQWGFWKEKGYVVIKNAVPREQVAKTADFLWEFEDKKVYDAFVDVWGTEKLWVTIDRANLNFPIRPGFEYKGFIHWDYDPDTKPQNVQGVLALADQTDENMGG